MNTKRNKKVSDNIEVAYNNDITDSSQIYCISEVEDLKKTLVNNGCNALNYGCENNCAVGSIWKTLVVHAPISINISEAKTKQRIEEIKSLVREVIPPSWHLLVLPTKEADYKFEQLFFE